MGEKAKGMKSVWRSLSSVLGRNAERSRRNYRDAPRSDALEQAQTPCTRFLDLNGSIGQSRSCTVQVTLFFLDHEPSERRQCDFEAGLSPLW